MYIYTGGVNKQIHNGQTRWCSLPVRVHGFLLTVMAPLVHVTRPLALSASLVHIVDFVSAILADFMKLAKLAKYTPLKNNPLYIQYMILYCIPHTFPSL